MKKHMLVFLILVLLLTVRPALADELNLPAMLTDIGDEAFMGDTSLDTVILPDSLKTIGDRAFANSSINMIVIPESVNSISASAFSGSPNVIIYGISGSNAQRYANENEIPFVATDIVLPTSVTLDNESITLDEGQTITIHATVLPENAADKSVYWLSSDNSIVSVDDGAITGVSEGFATVYAITGFSDNTLGEERISASCEVTVYAPIPLAQTLTAATDCDSVLLAWNQVNTAQGYELYRSESQNGNYSLIAQLNSDMVLSYNDCPPSKQTNYFYKVKPIILGDRGLFSNVASGKSVNPNVSISENEITIKVNETKQLFTSVEKCYDVYLHELWYSSDDSIAEVDSNNGIVKGNAVGTATVSVLNSGVELQCVVHVEPAIALDKPVINDVLPVWKDTLRIDWQHVENAMGYYVYRSTSKSGTYSLIGRVAFSSAGHSAIEGNIDVPNPGGYIYYEDSTATGTKYYYKVQAFDKDGNTGSQSKAVGSNTVDKSLSTPTIVSIKSAKTGLCINWNQNSDYDDSTEFAIYRSTDSLTDFTYIGDAGEDYSFVDTSSSDGTEYYYAVQAQKVSGSSFLGGSVLSQPKSARYDSSIRHVDSITLTGINLLDNHEEIEPGETLQLGANVSPSNATDKSVTWRSTNPTIVQVDSTGLVTGVSYGTAKIICRSVSDPEVRASRMIYVGEDEEELDFLDVEIDEANQKIKVRASGDWTAATDEWITLSKYSGTGRETITYTLAENEDEDDRIGNISFICGTETQNLSITQEGSDGGVSVVHVNYGAGTEVTDPEVTVVHVDYGAGTHVINNTYSITITHPILGTIVDDGTQIITSFGVWNGNGIMNWEVSGSSIWHVDMGNCSWLAVTKVNNNQLQIKTLSGVSPRESRKAQFSLHVGTQCLSFEVIQKGPDVIVSHSYEDKNFYNRNGEGDDTFAMLTAKDGTASNLQVNSTEPWSAYVVKQVDGAWTQSTSDWVEVSCTNTVLTLTNKEGSDKTREREEYIKIDVAPYSSIVIRITRPKALNPVAPWSLTTYSDELSSYAVDIISANESNKNYQSVRAIDGAAPSIGIFQWNADRALNILRRIAYKNPTLAYSILGETLYNEIETSGTSWTNKGKLSYNEFTAIQTLLNTTEGRAAQDEQAESDAITYLRTGRSYGITDKGALLQFADVSNLGTGFAQEVASSAKNNAGSYAAITLRIINTEAHNHSVIGDSNGYKSRHNTTYNTITSLYLSSVTPYVVCQYDYGDQTSDLYYECSYGTSCPDDFAAGTGKHTILSSGCGLCAIVNAIDYLTGNRIDIHDVAQYARENGGYKEHDGTYWKFYEEYATAFGETYGFKRVTVNDTLASYKEFLQNGGVIIIGCTRINGTGGHVIVIADYNSITDQFLILDSVGDHTPKWTGKLYGWYKINSTYQVIDGSGNALIKLTGYSQGKSRGYIKR